jgi:transcriptional regulator with XRE-family HTH domain/predicted Fe-Mo cluster-binding NifX family protein
MTIGRSDLAHQNDQNPAEALVGQKLRQLRTGRGLSLRALADRSGLNINTLSLIEKGRSSPTVSTLQQLALTLDVPLTIFFESEPIEKQVVFTPAGQRPKVAFANLQIQNLGNDLAGRIVQPFFVTLKPGVGSGDRLIVHTGHEFVYCLTGSIQYCVDQNEFTLNPGDSLVFEAHLPHCWENTGEQTSQILLVLFPSDLREEPGDRHFSPETLQNRISMKIAAITEDGKTISQHFGRASHYLVLTIEEGKIVNREMRSKFGHDQFNTHLHVDASRSAGHGMGPDSRNKHMSMAETIADCKAVLCGGMGMGAYKNLHRLNIQPVVTDVCNIDEAVQAFLEGKLIDHTELLH